MTRSILGAAAVLSLGAAMLSPAGGLVARTTARTVVMPSAEAPAGTPATQPQARLTILSRSDPGSASAVQLAAPTGSLQVGAEFTAGDLVLDVDREAARLLAGRGLSAAGTATLPRGGKPPAYAPLRSYRLTGGFGYRTHPVTGQRAFHAGIDMAAPAGTPVLATQAGSIGYADWAGGYGLAIRVDGAGGYSTIYGHLSGIAVAPGAFVSAGQVIGYVGSTGRSTGPHLHYEVRRGNGVIDPLSR